MQQPLFSEYRLGELTLPNRLVMAPMTRTRANSSGEMGELNARYYSQRASAGLIISEATQVSPLSRGIPNTPGIYTPGQIAGWRTVVDAVHAAGGRIYLQLWHCGRVSDPSLLGGELPVAPSAIAAQGEIMTPNGFRQFASPRELATGEVQGIVAEFETAARGALAAGFDGVELHAALGYLVDQFLQSGSNHRSDRYGGSIANRCRFLFEICEALAGVWSAERIGVKLSPSSRLFGMIDRDPEITFSRAIEGLNAMKIGHIQMMEPSPEDLGERETLREPSLRFRPKFNGTMIANNGFDQNRANMILENGGADLVSFGRLFLANPDLPDRLLSGKPLNQPDFSTCYGSGEKGYTDYPFISQHPLMQFLES